ncbi:DUF5696 domain-containing protein [Tengunoibacter tsumagoiensis]|uniref:Uncharacterized protein n=1 Tax=Tengunoibacter tsumagoiensis TaxID=2014871 RepID=A0A402A3C7_9CHLR|nr:DUF5696 domain-containing protein [Tengunoibacter tsumagoiensis]GCE13644.1 hypothetical protein KTT_35030 [Tengunoibacter tsumagoiensis]
MSEIIWHAENEYIDVTFYQDASADILDKGTQTRWHMGHVVLQEDNPIDVGHVWLRTERSMCEEYPGRFQGERSGDEIRFTLLGRERREVGQFSCQFQLQGPKFIVSIVEIAESIPSLMFPPAIESESLVLPMGVGKWLRNPLAERRFWLYPSHLNMRWFGGLRGQAGWIAIVEDGYVNGGVHAHTLRATPGWLKSLGQWRGKRTISYQFVSGDYVTLAKTYRAYALAHGLHRSLTEKIQQTPALNNFLGGRLLSFMQANSVTAEREEDSLQPSEEAARLEKQNPQVGITHKQATQLITAAVEQGLKKGLVVLRGWIKGGYDETHPDIWPPDPAVGTQEELQETLELHDSFTVALHDNYQDIYQQSASWPQGVIRTRSGDPMPGGLWSGGQAYILNARDGLAYAQRNWEQIKTLRPRAMFIDTTIAVQFYESYEQGNELTRAQDEALKQELLQFYKDQGQVLGSEEGADFGVPFVDWIENRHGRIAGVSIPLWPLVFHDAAFSTRYGPPPQHSESAQSSAPRWLTDMLWGYPLIWGFSKAQQGNERLSEIADMSHVDQWLERIGTQEMLSHRYVSADGEVEETTFASGDSIIVNFSDYDREIEGEYLPAHSYRLRH